RAKTVQTIQQMKQAHTIHDEWPDSEIVARGKEIEKEQQLLAVDFTFASTDRQEVTNNDSLINHWGVWALLSMLATLMLFDWIIKEKQSPVIKRLTFSQLTIKKYLLFNLLLYTGLLLAFDFL